MSLSGKVALVTGASRGIGRGIAVQLGEAGATVYITGRAPEHSDQKHATELPTLEKTANEVTERGGKGIAVYCDHGNPEDVAKLFDRIKSETKGQLDILVNNAYAAVNLLTKNVNKTFWEMDPLVWDTVNNVGLRNHYVCSVYAARMMVPRKSGLIVTVSSAGGLRYIFNVAYGVGKAACDRLAADTAFELQQHNVASISLWPGAVRTELITKNFSEPVEETSEAVSLTRKHMKEMFEQGETTEFSGKCIAALAADPNLMKKTGRILITADLASEYGLVDIDGRSPHSLRSLRTMLNFGGWTGLASWCPSWLKLPGWMLTAGSSKI